MLRMMVVAGLIGLAAAPALAHTDASARCEEASFRIYFAQGAAALNDEARQMLAIAARNVADCDYAELRVALDAQSPIARARAEAIEAAAGAWDRVRIEAAPPRGLDGPEFAQITATPERSAAPEAEPPEGEAGV